MDFRCNPPICFVLWWYVARWFSDSNWWWSVRSNAANQSWSRDIIQRYRYPKQYSNKSACIIHLSFDSNGQAEWVHLFRQNIALLTNYQITIATFDDDSLHVALTPATGTSARPTSLVQNSTNSHRSNLVRRLFLWYKFLRARLNASDGGCVWADIDSGENLYDTMMA